MSLGSDHQHDYPERGWRPRELASPAGKRPELRLQDLGHNTEMSASVGRAIVLNDANSGNAPEPFVSADEAARFLSIKRRHLLALARKGLPGAYGLGTGTQRKIWVFRLSELANAIAGQSTLTPKSEKWVSIRLGSLHAEKRRQ